MSAVLLMLIPSFSLMSDGLNDSGVFCHVEIVERDIAGTATRNDQFTKTCFYLSPDQWMLSQDG